jgi:DNA modification methylase
MSNRLFCGDNLEVLRRYFADDSVDLIYLDPPFKSDQDYNLLFKDKSGKKSASQILAFEDTWEWSHEAERNLSAVMESGGKTSQVMALFRTMLGESDMLAYLAMMAPRLIELHRVLKSSGSIYLHCDPTASHYLKTLMDSIFGGERFRGEIAWRRSRGHNDRSLTRFGANHDVLLYYTKGDSWTFNRVHHERDAASPKTHDHYLHSDGKLYRKGDCTAPGGRGPKYDWNGFVRNWRFSPEQKRELEQNGLIVYSKNGMPRVLRLIDDPSRGHPLQDTWTDIDPPNSGSKELLGYPTQKPKALLERIISVSSNPGDTILDPFCGCGTAIEAAEKLMRQWSGIDVTIQAMRVIRNERLQRLGYSSPKDYRVVYLPADISAAEAFAAEQPFAFQDWAVEMLNGIPTRTRSGDRGIDGRLYFQSEDEGPLRQILVSVKGGKLKSNFVRELQGAVARERAPMGVLLTLNEPSKQMIRDIHSSGVYSCSAGTFPKTQFITVQQILSGTLLNLPPIRRMDELKKRAMAAAESQMRLPGVG